MLYFKGKQMHCVCSTVFRSSCGFQQQYWVVQDQQDWNLYFVYVTKTCAGLWTHTFSNISFSINSKRKAGLTWALVRLRVPMWYRSPGISSTFSSLGTLWIGCPVVVGAPRGVRVPHRPGIITITSLEETERENVRDRRSRETADEVWRVRTRSGACLV